MAWLISHRWREKAGWADSCEWADVDPAEFRAENGFYRTECIILWAKEYPEVTAEQMQEREADTWGSKARD